MSLCKRQLFGLPVTKMQGEQRACLESGLLNQEILFLVFKSAKWNPFLIATIASVCQQLAEYAKQELWKEFCISRGPKIVHYLVGPGGPQSADIPGGWPALGRLLLYCAGCHPSRQVRSRTVPGHFVQTTRFSKTSGRCFLIPPCRSDILYVSDPCEHVDESGDKYGDIGLYRGMFMAFSTSETLKFLIKRKADIEPKKTCPFCFDKVWSMLGASLIPGSAMTRLGSFGDVEHFVCPNGHLHGRCCLLHLSDTEED